MAFSYARFIQPHVGQPPARAVRDQRSSEGIGTQSTGTRSSFRLSNLRATSTAHFPLSLASLASLANTIEDKLPLAHRIKCVYEQSIFQQLRDGPTKRNFEYQKHKKKAGNGNALQHLTQALAHAKENDEAVQVYLDRAKVLIKMNKPILAILDLNRALILPNTSELKIRAERMKNFCVDRLRQDPLARARHAAKSVTRKPRARPEAVLPNSRSWSGSVDSDNASDEISTEVTSISMPSLTSPLPATPRPNDALSPPNITDFCYGSIEPTLPEGFRRHSCNRSASKKISLKRFPIKRRLVPELTEEQKPILAAVEVIEPGECIMLLEPYATMLSQEYWKTHCSHCVIKCDSLIPCRSCSLVMFCGETCREKAHATYHNTECQYLSHLVVCERSDIEMLVMRLVLNFTKQGEALIELKSQKFSEELFAEHIFETIDEIEVRNHICAAKTISKLRDNLQNMKEEDRKERYKEAVFLLNVLKQTKYFEACGQSSSVHSNILTDMEVFVGCLLLKCLCVAQFCSHRIKSSVVPTIRRNTLQPLRGKDIGLSFYPLLHTNLLAQSCNPNAIVVNFRNHAYVYSTEPISPDQKITISWVEDNTFWLKTKNVRTNALKKLWTRKSCQACDKNWGTAQKLKATESYLSSATELLQMKSECDEIWVNRCEIRDIRKALYNAGDIEKICIFSRLLHEQVAKPHYGFAKCKTLMECILCHRVRTEYWRKIYDVENSIYAMVPMDAEDQPRDRAPVP